MDKYAQHLGWLTRFAICVFALLLANSVLAVISMFFPYIPSHGVSSFCYYVLPFVLFLLLGGVGLVGNVVAKQSGGHSFHGGWLGPVLSGAILSILWSLMILQALAIPTKYLANQVTDMPVVVNKLSGFRAIYSHFVWIYYRKNGLVGKFMWTRTELVDSMKEGDCINLHGRRWLSGFYVDSISRANSCEVKTSPD